MSAKLIASTVLFNHIWAASTYAKVLHCQKKIVFPYTEYPVLKLLQEFQLFFYEEKK